MDSITNYLGFGGASLTSIQSQRQVMDLLHTAYESGIRHFDTAPLYGRGYSELLIGNFIKKNRVGVTVTSKFGLGNVETGFLPPVFALPLNYYKKKLQKRPSASSVRIDRPTQALLSYRRINAEEIKSSFQRSLRRLQTDYIDYYLLHEGVPSFLTEEALAYLFDLKKKGLIRFTGIATDSFNISKIAPAELNNWDLLQYESGIGVDSNDLQNRYPGKMHFHHSCLKYIDGTSLAGIAEKDKGGYLLSQCAAWTKNGKILFSTRRKDILQYNLAAFVKYFLRSS